MLFEYRAEIVQLLRSPTHAYFGRSKDGPAKSATDLPTSVEIVAHKGIRGDRFFGVKAHTEAAVSFLAVEAWEAVGDVLGVDVPDPSVARRNVVVRGLELDPLRGLEFELDSGDGWIRFRGGRPAHPCAWMDRMVVDGARKALIGRGGLRVEPLSDGILRVGELLVRSPVELDPSRAALSIRRAQPI
ncbi:molybdenum cofactor biosysynthesis protein [Rhodococcus sp. 06-470-2]|uniref:molybdenum cofactor biosysynthesis protein n=1 Tax=unclassified Rhodococcus (in: high G+C Gram-positive bacteria) TaxID=192944 RepID=UPI000B9BC4A1|nr:MULTISPECIES: molybdenum cofactor biosysynthesis protein [unclassified Rhodococcus (in: high G+C Gram-positive bacteria)]OZC67033.1 molybdenum cofactor biosysynthesis protein [Rhodococcus sp. 06-470-2]OZE58705.1 molybdenum cofactor biosysynthesis protein [Rhodococcus sp. 05-2221-1B]